MRSQPVALLLSNMSLVRTLVSSKALPSVPFHPTVDDQTIFFLSTYTALAASGSFAKIPYLPGNGDYEAGYYKVSAVSQSRSLTADQWDNFNLEPFTCATGHAVQARANAGVATWRYRYFGDWDNLRLYPGRLLFGTTSDLTRIEDPALEAGFGVNMQH